jgi:hypothetical protein
VLRLFAIDKLGADRVSVMSDSDVKKWLEEEGFQSYIEYYGEYDDNDAILIAKKGDVDELVSCGKAFWATRSGKYER